jgi:hypothetical protein
MALNAECVMLSVAKLNVVILNVVAPWGQTFC